MSERSMVEKLMMLVLYANNSKMEWEKLKWAVFILLKMHEEGVVTLERGAE